MKKTLLTSALVIGLMASANASWYVGGGVAIPANGTTTVYGTLGHAFDNGLRLEARLFEASRSFEQTGEGIGSVYLGASQSEQFSGSFGLYEMRLLYDVRDLTWNNITPFVGIGVTDFGLGFDRSERPGFMEGQSSVGFGVTGSVIFGLTWAATDRLNLDIEYNRTDMSLDMGKLGWSLSSDAREFRTRSGENLFKIGMRYRF